MKTIFSTQRKRQCEYEYVSVEYSTQYMHANEKDRTGWKKTQQGQSHMDLFKMLREMYKRNDLICFDKQESWVLLILILCSALSFSVVTWLNLVLSHSWSHVYARAQHTKLYLFFRQSSVNEDSVIGGSLNASWLWQLWFFPNPR